LTLSCDTSSKLLRLRRLSGFDPWGLTTIQLRSGLYDLNRIDLSPAIVEPIRIIGPKIPNIFTCCIWVRQDIKESQDFPDGCICDEGSILGRRAGIKEMDNADPELGIGIE
jgi:hypothetical protein